MLRLSFCVSLGENSYAIIHRHLKAPCSSFSLNFLPPLFPLVSDSNKFWSLPLNLFSVCLCLFLPLCLSLPPLLPLLSLSHLHPLTFPPHHSLSRSLALALALSPSLSHTHKHTESETKNGVRERETENIYTFFLYTFLHVRK